MIPQYVIVFVPDKGRALDNVFVERLWRTVKQEGVYLKGYRNISECREGLRTYFDRYTISENTNLSIIIIQQKYMREKFC